MSERPSHLSLGRVTHTKLVSVRCGSVFPVLLFCEVGEGNRRLSNGTMWGVRWQWRMSQ
jgi:hypothetical protein